MGIQFGKGVQRSRQLDMGNDDDDDGDGYYDENI